MKGEYKSALLQTCGFQFSGLYRIIVLKRMEKSIYGIPTISPYNKGCYGISLKGLNCKEKKKVGTHKTNDELSSIKNKKN